MAETGFAACSQHPTFHEHDFLTQRIFSNFWEVIYMKNLIEIEQLDQSPILKIVLLKENKF